MKYSYPIVLTQGKEYILVYIPDFNINTQGKTHREAIDMARYAIQLMVVDMQSDSFPIPAPSLSLDPRDYAGSTLCFVDITVE